MISELPQSGRYTGAILLADISGYSSFLNDVQDAHRSDAFADGQIPPAYAMMSSFLEGIAGVVDPPFDVIKFEGDAVFALAGDEVAPRGAALIDLVGRCYLDFTERRAAATVNWVCTCNACARKDALDLKFVVHHGEYFIQVTGGQCEALGPDVNMAHRLLKNSAVDVVGSMGYGLFTEATVEALGLPLDDAAVVIEPVDGRPVKARVMAMGSAISG